jgi:hypothetical protein
MMSPTFPSEERLPTPSASFAGSPPLALDLLLEAVNADESKADSSQILTPPQSPEPHTFRNNTSAYSNGIPPIKVL